MNKHFIELSALEENILNGKQQYQDISYLKRYNLIIICSLVNNLFNSGNILEIGVGNGETSAYIRNYFNNNFTYYMFDSYEGLSEPTKEDMISSYHVTKGNMKCEIEKIQNFMNINCENKNIQYIKGWVNNTIPEQLPDNICFAHIDVDLYEPIYHSIKHIIPKMKKNGIILIDDYNDPIWIGVKSACDLIEQEFNVKITRINPPGSILYQAILQIL
jgi:O-methyltransferase